MTFRDNKGFFLLSFCSLQHRDPKVDTSPAAATWSIFLGNLED